MSRQGIAGGPSLSFPISKTGLLADSCGEGTLTISAEWTGSGGQGWPSQRGPLFCVTCLSPGGAAVSG